MVAIKVKWGKETYDVEIEPNANGTALKTQLQALTSVPVEKQKIMGVKGGQLKDDTVALSDVGVTEGKALMLIGTAEALPPPPQEAIVFAEDVKGGHDALLPSTNGLINIGNTCYMNAAVQTLRIIPELRDILSQPTTPPLGKKLLELFTALDGSREAIPPMQFWVTLMAAHPNFAEPDSRGHPMQHDSQEALAAMLQVGIQQIASDPALKSKYQSLFAGTLKQTTTTTVPAPDPDAPASTTSHEDVLPFGILQCNISGDAQTLEAGLEQGLEEVVSPEGTAEGPLRTIKRTSRFNSLPEYLVVHFVRFQWRRDINAKTKILKPITFPLVLDVFSLCTEELKEAMAPQREAVRVLRDKEIERRKRQRQKSGHDEDEEAAAAPTGVVPGEAEAEASKTNDIPLQIHNENGFYELCGIISHKGRDSEGGHYVAWVLKAGTWLVVDDKNSAAVATEDIQHLRGGGDAHIAYVLLYRSRDPVTKKLPLLL